MLPWPVPGVRREPRRRYPDVQGRPCATSLPPVWQSGARRRRRKRGWCTETVQTA